MHRLALLAVVACTLSAGCGPSPQQVAARHQPALAALRQKLVRIAAQLPRGPVAEQTAQLSPPLLLAPDNPAANGADLMASELTGQEPAFDLTLTSHLTTALYWSEHPAPSGGDPQFMEQTFAAARSTRYLVVYRVDEAALPQAVSGETFVGGDVPVELLVFDLEREALVAAGRIIARPAAAVEFSVQAHESAQQRLEASARSSVWSAARQQLAAKLAEISGGQVARP